MEEIAMVAQDAAMRFARSAIEGCEGVTGKIPPEATGSLVGWIRRLGDRDPEVGAALTLVLAAPTDRTRVELLGKILAKRLDSDPTVDRQLRDVANGVPPVSMEFDFYEGVQQRQTALALDIGLAWGE